MTYKLPTPLSLICNKDKYFFENFIWTWKTWNEKQRIKKKVNYTRQIGIIYKDSNRLIKSSHLHQMIVDWNDTQKKIKQINKVKMIA